jgi:hypothetical protein
MNKNTRQYKATRKKKKKKKIYLYIYIGLDLWVGWQWGGSATQLFKICLEGCMAFWE